MKFSCDSALLSKALSDVSHALSSKASLPVLSHILLEVTSEKLILSATNLEVSIRTALPVESAEPGAACLPGRLFVDLISSLPKGEVSVSEKNNTVFVKNAKTQAKVNGLNPNEFPKINLEGTKVADLNPREFVGNLQQVVFAAANDESRPILTGILMEGEGEQLTLVGVDGFRLSEKKIKLASPVTALKQVVPAKALLEIGRLVGGEENLEMLISLEENQMVFKTPHFEIGTRLLEGAFPDYQKIIPTTHTTKVEVELSDLREALKTVSVFARDQNSVVKVVINSEKNSLSFSAVAAEMGENETTIDALVESKGEPVIEVAFNARYLSEALGSFSREKIEIRATGALAPGVFVTPGQEDYLHLIMPIRIQS